ncbi:hypothetical protein [Jiella sp. M17.18]|uniref:hypothetical protein n=1 Tax=Jiella sp. M17.18 TaxID=3234247 RepID=UPI0034DFFB69
MSAYADDAATVGSGGSASAGDTSASTLGTAGATTDDNGDYAASIGSGGSAASGGGKTKSQTKVNANPYKLNARSRAMAHDKGTFSKSKTKTKVKGGDLSSRTKTMSHVPGQKPVMNRTQSDASLNQ